MAGWGWCCARMVASVASAASIDGGSGTRYRARLSPAPTLIATSSGRRTAIADSSVMSSPAKSTRRAGSASIRARSADPLSSGRVDSSITSLPSRQNVPAISSASPRTRSSAPLGVGIGASAHMDGQTCRLVLHPDPRDTRDGRSDAGTYLGQQGGLVLGQGQVGSDLLAVRPDQRGPFAGPTDGRQVLPCASGEQHDLRARGAGEPSHHLERTGDRPGGRRHRDDGRDRPVEVEGHQQPVGAAAGGQRVAEVR